jgi:hypothetical protein
VGRAATYAASISTKSLPLWPVASIAAIFEITRDDLAHIGQRFASVSSSLMHPARTER